MATVRRKPDGLKSQAGSSYNPQSQGRTRSPETYVDGLQSNDDKKNILGKIQRELSGKKKACRCQGLSCFASLNGTSVFLTLETLKYITQ